jgi:Arc-like DNA binding dprotein
MSGRKRRPVQFNIRVAAELRDNLRKAAKRHGVSLNEETAVRLGRSFGEERLFGGERGRQFFYFLATTFVLEGERHYRDTPQGKEAGKDPDISLWIKDPDIYQAALLGTIYQLILQQPDATAERCALQSEDLRVRLVNHFMQKAELKRRSAVLPKPKPAEDAA